MEKYERGKHHKETTVINPTGTVYGAVDASGDGVGCGDCRQRQMRRVHYVDTRLRRDADHQRDGGNLYL